MYFVVCLESPTSSMVLTGLCRNLKTATQKVANANKCEMKNDKDKK
jgi:hypothetical protein